jgi:urease accessory protein
VVVDPREPETSRPALASTRQTPASDGNEADFPWDTHQPFDAPVGKNGLLHLDFESRGERTILASLERRTPLLAQKALYFDEAMPDMACVFMTSGCVLGG